MATAMTEHARIPNWGMDRAKSERPGVPHELRPRPLPRSHWTTPARQAPVVTVLKRAGLAELTPVFSTAVPPHGVSGDLRRLAYRIPEDRASHWMLLLFADRVDVVTSDPLGLLRRAWPAVAAIALAGAAIGAARRHRRRSWFR